MELRTFRGQPPLKAEAGDSLQSRLGVVVRALIVDHFSCSQAPPDNPNRLKAEAEEFFVRISQNRLFRLVVKRWRRCEVRRNQPQHKAEAGDFLNTHGMPVFDSGKAAVCCCFLGLPERRRKKEKEKKTNSPIPCRRHRVTRTFQFVHSLPRYPCARVSRWKVPSLTSWTFMAALGAMRAVMTRLTGCVGCQARKQMEWTRLFGLNPCTVSPYYESSAGWHALAFEQGIAEKSFWKIVVSKVLYTLLK